MSKNDLILYGKLAKILVSLEIVEIVSASWKDVARPVQRKFRLEGHELYHRSSPLLLMVRHSCQA